MILPAISSALPWVRRRSSRVATVSVPDAIDEPPVDDCGPRDPPIPSYRVVPEELSGRNVAVRQDVAEFEQLGDDLVGRLLHAELARVERDLGVERGLV